MKTNLCRAGLAVLLSTLSASAVTVAHVEDSVTRTWFTVSWEEIPFAPLAFLKNGPLSDAGAVDNTASVHVDAIHPFFIDGFNINFALGSRLFSTATIDDFEGVQLLALPGNDYGVQVVYGEPVPQNGSVPEGGGTAALLGLASGMVWWLRRQTPAMTPRFG